MKRFNLYLPDAVVDKLESAMKLSGNRTMAKTVQHAIAVYEAVLEEVGNDRAVTIEVDGKRIKLIL